MVNVRLFLIIMVLMLAFCPVAFANVDQNDEVQVSALDGSGLDQILQSVVLGSLGVDRVTAEWPDAIGGGTKMAIEQSGAMINSGVIASQAQSDKLTETLYIGQGKLGVFLSASAIRSC